MEIVRIKLSALEPNTGQIPGLPMNPRQWTATDVDRIANSLQETPELFEARPLLVYPLDKKFIILGGNLRHEGAKRNKMKDAPCIVFTADTPIEKLKEIVIKDNGSFGDWDFDALGNEWDDLPLTDWGVPAWEPDKDTDVDEGEETSPADKGYNIQYNLVFNNEDEQDRWYAFLEMLKRKYPDVDTISERVLLETDKLVRDAD